MGTITYHREMAELYESARQWNFAAQQWEKVLAAYPKITSPEMAVEKSRFAVRLEACITMDNAESVAMQGQE